MEKIKNLSLKKTIVLYITVALLCSFLLSAAIMNTATMVQQQVWLKYIDKEKYYKVVQGENNNYEISIPRVSQYDMNTMDGHISELCDFLETYAVLFLSVTASCIAVGLFYRNKLKIPIKELGEASKMIAKDELDFHVTYENQDELGQLCKEFEKMRAQLEENNRTVWNIMEDEKALRAAIAHDIRSPLAVLKGYQEMLLEFVPEGAINKRQIISMLQEGMEQIDRMNRFIETMRKMVKLEERELQFTDIDMGILGKQIQKEAEIIGRKLEKTCMVRVQVDKENFSVDEEIILEVVENLLSNAFRYAKEGIEVLITSVQQELIITVMDDGIGFTENPEIVTSAFYHSNSQDSLQHFGMGMYISRIYCERHGGRLLVGNHENGGAVVKAVFKSN